MKGKKSAAFIKANRTIISQKIKESFSSVMPVTAIVLLLCFTIVPVPSGTFLAFLIGALLLVVGMGLFTLGADTAMTPIGEYVGTTVMKSKKIWVIVLVCFLVGVMITVSEPDLQVLAEQISAIPNVTMILTVSAGVGVFLVFAFLRTVLKIKLKYILIFFYAAVFIMAIFVPESFIPMAFDAGGVTTGPMSVPFIMAIGAGVASMRSDKSADDDSFGLTALCSIGPVIAVMILGLVFKPESADYSAPEIVIENSRDMIVMFGKALPKYLAEVGIALLPILAFFFIFQLFGGKLGKAKLLKILIGALYTYFGLVLFLVGVNVGFTPVASFLGDKIGKLPYKWIAVPLGMVLGFFVVAAEPAVHVLTKQVYEITSGTVPKRALSLSLMIGVAVSVGLAMLRILCHIPIIYFLAPGYAIAIILTFIVPDIFTAIAFDSGGVASGAMTASFLLPLALGLCSAVGGNVAAEGFGVVAMVAMTPLITIQLLGLFYKIKVNKAKKAEAKAKAEAEAKAEKEQEEIEEIID